MIVFMPKPVRLLLLCAFAGAAQANESLIDVYRLAQDNDAALQMAEARHRATLEGESIAWSALLPKVSWEYDLSESLQRQEGSSFGREGGRDRYTTRQDRLNLSQTLYHHDVYVELGRAEARSARAMVQRDASRQDLILRVADTYFRILAAQDNALFAHKEKEALALQLEQAEARFEVGLTAIVEVKETQAAHDLTVAREIEALNQLDNEREALTVVTGHPHGDLAALSDRLKPTTPDPADIQAWTDSALDHNLEYLIEKHALDVARHTVAFEKAKHWPTLDFQAALTDNEDTGGIFSQMQGNRLKTDRFQLQLRVPLFAGGETLYRTRQAAFEEEAVRAQLLATRRSVEQSARSAYRNVVAGIARIQAFQRALESAQVDLEATQAGLEAGTRDAVDVIQATSRLYAAERDYAQARYDYLLGSLRLRQAAGQLGLTDVEWTDRLLD